MLSSFTFSHFWEDNIMFSALAGRHGHGVCKVICFLRGTFLGSDFHFPLWVWCDWQRARCSCVAHTDVKNTQLWESEITIQRGGGEDSRKPNLVVWFDGLCSSGNVHICHLLFFIQHREINKRWRLPLRGEEYRLHIVQCLSFQTYQFW